MSRELVFDYSKTAGFIREEEIVNMKKAVLGAKEVLTEKTGAGNDFLGWIDLPVDYDKDEFDRIKKAAEKIKGDSDVLLVIGIGGSPMAEVLNNNLAEIEASDIHERLKLEKGRYILLSAHREENIDTEKNFTSLFTAINRMAEKYDMPVLYSCHPRSRKRLEASGFALDPRVIRHEPLGFHDYNCLQMNAFCVVSDSGTLPEESSFFTSIGHPFPAVCIRTSTERPEALDKACFILAGIDEKSLLQAVDTAVTMNQNGDHGIPVPDYVEENVSAKVVKIIQSYTGVVDKMVWRKF